MSSISTLQHRVRRIGLAAGPVLALFVYFVLPLEYRAADGATVPFTHAGRATLAMMAWMATWWMTEAVDIEVTDVFHQTPGPGAGERA